MTAFLVGLLLGVIRTVIHILEGLSLKGLLKGWHEGYLKTWTEGDLSWKWSVMGSEKPTGNRVAECSRELELFSFELERYEEVYLFTHLSCMVIWEELGPRWAEGHRREEKGEESRCSELGHIWLAGGQRCGGRLLPHTRPGNSPAGHVHLRVFKVFL